MKRAIYVLLAVLGVVFWITGTAFYGIVTWLAILGAALYPTTTYGNCWTFALPRWWHGGGYLVIRASQGILFLNRFPIPHIMWVKELPPGTVLEQFQPLPEDRKKASWIPWHVFWFKGRINHKETKQD